MKNVLTPNIRLIFSRDQVHACIRLEQKNDVSTQRPQLTRSDVDGILCAESRERCLIERLVR